MGIYPPLTFLGRGVPPRIALTSPRNGNGHLMTSFAYDSSQQLVHVGEFQERGYSLASPHRFPPLNSSLFLFQGWGKVYPQWKPRLKSHIYVRKATESAHDCASNWEWLPSQEAASGQNATRKEAQSKKRDTHQAHFLCDSFWSGNFLEHHWEMRNAKPDTFLPTFQWLASPPWMLTKTCFSSLCE